MEIPDYTIEIRVGGTRRLSITPFCRNSMGSGILCRVVTYGRRDKVEILSYSEPELAAHANGTFTKIVPKYPISFEDLDRYRKGNYLLPTAYKEWLEELEEKGYRNHE